MTSHADNIQTILNQFEQQYHMTILFAVESGSRVWGFDSPNSDYDIRFVYYYPMLEYLKLGSLRRQISVVANNKLYDFEGWDIYKYLNLLAKSNPQTIEWLHSNIIYHPLLTPELLGLAQQYFDPRVFYRHHRSLTLQNYKKHIRNQSEILAKKYLYCLRGYYSAEYVLQTNTFPPLDFQELLEACRPFASIPDAIQELITLKRKGQEKQLTSPITVIDDLLDSFLEQRSNDPPNIQQSMDVLNQWLILMLEKDVS